jgi:ferric-dicitrate binding protein FerR (iron transport regulator)
MPESLTLEPKASPPQASSQAPATAPRRRLGGVAAVIVGAALVAGGVIYWTMGRESAAHYVTRQI